MPERWRVTYDLCARLAKQTSPNSSLELGFASHFQQLCSTRDVRFPRLDGLFTIANQILRLKSVSAAQAKCSDTHFEETQHSHRNETFVTFAALGIT